MFAKELFKLLVFIAAFFTIFLIIPNMVHAQMTPYEYWQQPVEKINGEELVNILTAKGATVSKIVTNDATIAVQLKGKEFWMSLSLSFMYYGTNLNQFGLTTVRYYRTSKLIESVSLRLVDPKKRVNADLLRLVFDEMTRLLTSCSTQQKQTIIKDKQHLVFVCDNTRTAHLWSYVPERTGITEGYKQWKYKQHRFEYRIDFHQAETVRN